MKRKSPKEAQAEGGSLKTGGNEFEADGSGLEADGTGGTGGNGLGAGYIHVYTGAGKGKTTAALGLGLRAVGHGLRVCLAQFLKGGPSGELESIKKLAPLFTVCRFAEKRDFFWKLGPEEKEQVRHECARLFDFVRQVVNAGQCDVLILDEALGALGNGLLNLEDLLELLRRKPAGLEIVLTGREAPPELLELAHLVTEMREVKHYYRQGLTARPGIEK